MHALRVAIHLSRQWRGAGTGGLPRGPAPLGADQGQQEAAAAAREIHHVRGVSAIVINHKELRRGWSVVRARSGVEPPLPSPSGERSRDEAALMTSFFHAAELVLLHKVVPVLAFCLFCVAC